MQSLTERVPGIRHPLVRDVYLKRDFKAGGRNVLVIETGEPARTRDGADKEDHLMDLLLDLQKLKANVEAGGYRFDRVDIRSFHPFRPGLH